MEEVDVLRMLFDATMASAKLQVSITYKGWELTAREIENRRINLVGARPKATE